MMWYSGNVPLEIYDPAHMGGNFQVFRGPGLNAYPCLIEAKAQSAGINPIYHILDDNDRSFIMDHRAYAELIHLAVMSSNDNLTGSDAKHEYGLHDDNKIYNNFHAELSAMGLDRIDVMKAGCHVMSTYIRFPSCRYRKFEIDNP